MTKAALIPQQLIERSILLVRGHKVILDEDLAELYDVEIRALNQAVKRNFRRFPEDFMFQLTAEEHADCQALRSHFGGNNSGQDCKVAKLGKSGGHPT